MAKKQFKTESKKMLDMMINSIYTHKEIFLRELISNASDAIDKRYFLSLTNPDAGLKKSDYAIILKTDKENRTITVRDNGCGMTEDELEKNLGTIAKSGSFDFKHDNEKTKDVDIIGQFGVGFYSAFMVGDKITVKSRSVNGDKAFVWESTGADGYSVSECDFETVGSEITIHLKEDTESEKYSEFLEAFRIEELVKKYSDYIRYPIKMDVETSRKKEGTENEYETVVENKTLNSMVPIWHRPQSKVSDEEYKNFYCEKFFDYQSPAKVIRTKSEGTVSYEALIFIPQKAPFDYYTKNFEKGLQLYSNGVMIMEKCPDLLPDYFSFVKGLVDSEDFTLNISRETLQHDHQLKIIAKNITKKIKNELEKMMEKDRENYEKFFDEFGIQLKYGVYADYGKDKDVLKDLLLFHTSAEDNYVSLKTYTERMKDGQKDIYYACGETTDKIDMLPQVGAVKAKGFEVLYLTDDIDEFVLMTLMNYADKKFTNVCADNLDISTEEEKNALKEENEKSEELLKFMKDSLDGAVTSVKFTNTLGSHPVCLSTEGGISTEMEKVLSKMPGNGFAPKAEIVLEINMEHSIANTLKSLYESDKDKIKEYSKILYTMARLISGLPVENPTELSNMVCNLM